MMNFCNMMTSMGSCLACLSGSAIQNSNQVDIVFSMIGGLSVIQLTMIIAKLTSTTGVETGLSDERIKAYKADFQHAYFGRRARAVLENMAKGTKAVAADRNLL